MLAFAGAVIDHHQCCGLGGHSCALEAAAVLRAAEGRPTRALKVVSDLAGQEGEMPSMTRFMLRAARLSATRLAPALEQLLLSPEPWDLEGS